MVHHEPDYRQAGNHVHLIARAAPGLKLQDILRDHKKFTAKAVVKAI